MNDSPLLDDDVLSRVREVQPLASADLLSPSGASADRVLARVLAADHGAASRPPRRAAPWRSARLAAAAAVAAAILGALVIASGGGPSIVARAYAATNPTGVIVHYVETSHSSLQNEHRPPDATEIWTYGNDSHQILFANDHRERQDIVATDGQLETLAFGTLAVTPGWPAGTRCSAAIVLEGGCVIGANNSPIAALRVLYRSGRIIASGQTTLNGRDVDVLTGHSGGLHLRALVDAHTFRPVKVEMVETFPQGRGVPPVTDALTISDYRRLPLTQSNRRLLALPAHAHARVIHLRAARRVGTSQR